LQQLSKNMEAGSEGLAALGISATDASGNLRSTNDVMMEVAQAFAGMEDGAGKTAIAMNIFGRAGANLIPLLNSGRTGLAQMAGEAENLGVVISGDAAKAAEQFNDNLTRLQTAAEGLAQQIIAPLLPSLIDLTNRLLALADTSTTLSDWFQNLYSWFEGLDPRIRTTRKEIEAIAGVLESMGLIEGFASPKSDLPFEVDIPGGDLPESGQPKTKAPSLSTGKDEKKKKSPVPGVAPSQEVGMFFIDRLEAIRDGFKSEREVLEEEYNLNQAVLDNALLNKAIKEQEYYDLSQKLAEEHAAALAAIQQASISQQLSDLSSGFGSMASAFQNGGKKMLRVSKAFAAAQAIVATIQAAVDAMKNPALIDPASKFAAYAAVFAKGMSAVAAIRGVSDSGGGGGGGGGGGRGGGRGGGGSSAPAAASPTTTFQFTLMNDPMGFGEKFARQFIDQLNATQRNGGQIRGVIA
jgi:hypothetical protein